MTPCHDPDRARRSCPSRDRRRDPLSLGVARDGLTLPSRLPTTSPDLSLGHTVPPSTDDAFQSPSPPVEAPGHVGPSCALRLAALRTTAVGTRPSEAALVTMTRREACQVCPRDQRLVEGRGRLRLDVPDPAPALGTGWMAPPSRLRCQARQFGRPWVDPVTGAGEGSAVSPLSGPSRDRRRGRAREGAHASSGQPSAPRAPRTTAEMPSYAGAQGALGSRRPQGCSARGDRPPPTAGVGLARCFRPLVPRGVRPPARRGAAEPTRSPVTAQRRPRGSGSVWPDRPRPTARPRPRPCGGRPRELTGASPTLGRPETPRGELPGFQPRNDRRRAASRRLGIEGCQGGRPSPIAGSAPRSAGAVARPTD